MRHRFLSFAITFAVGLGVSQASYACFSANPLTKKEVALADLIFEGSLQKITPEIRAPAEEKVQNLGPQPRQIEAEKKVSTRNRRRPEIDKAFPDFRNRPRYLDLTFNVKNLIQGEFDQETIVIRWNLDFTLLAQMSIEDFTKQYGDLTRVAVMTPQLADKFCEFKQEARRVSNEEKGLYISETRMIIDCTSSSYVMRLAKENQIPYVLDRSCASPYIFSVEDYEKQRDYEKNLEQFETLYKSGHVSRVKPNYLGNKILITKKTLLLISSVSIRIYSRLT